MTIIDSRKVNLAEKDIEDWLYENPKSIRVSKWIARQFRVPSGIIDLFGVSEYGGPVVVEVKNVDPDKAAVLQVCRYANDISEIINIRTNYRANFHVWKLIVSKSNISDELLYEADAVDVHIYSFNVSLRLDVSGPWGWNSQKSEKDDEDRRAISSMAFMSVFDALVPNEEESEKD